MLVRATQKGYYNLKRIKEGEIFELVPIEGLYKDDSKPGEAKPVKKTWTPEEQFSSKWMEKVDEPVARAKSKWKPRQEAKPVAEVEVSEDSDAEAEVI